MHGLLIFFEDELTASSRIVDFMLRLNKIKIGVDVCKKEIKQFSASL